MLRSAFIFSLAFFILIQALHAKTWTVKNGQELLDALNGAKAGDEFILKNGTYKHPSGGMFMLPSNVLSNGSINDITIRGESRDGVKITRDKSGSSTVSPTFYGRGNNWYIENITIENTNQEAQAIALRSRGSNIVLNNVKLWGFQDTFLAEGGFQYCYKCEVGGDVDFIYGDAAIMFDNSTIVSRARSNRDGGPITAPSDTKTFTGSFRHGILIKDSKVIAETTKNKSVLGRPWGDENTSSVFFNCELGSHIQPEGWNTMSDKNPYAAEYKSKKPDGSLVDVSKRVSWSKQVPESDKSKYEIPFFFKGWDPKKVIADKGGSTTPSSSSSAPKSSSSSAIQSSSSSSILELSSSSVTSPLNGTLVKELSVTAATWSIQSSVQVGDSVHGDRAVKWTSLPSFVAGKEYIRTSVDPKAATLNAQATFKAGAAITVSVLLDRRVIECTECANDNNKRALPAWLTGWAKSEDTAKSDNNVDFYIYRKDFAKDATVTLGANGLTTQTVVNYAVSVSVPSANPSGSSSSDTGSDPSSSSEGRTPILHSPISILNSERLQYYNLRGEPLGSAKPQTAGIYIVKQGSTVQKIVVR